jgi:hypothetical protein
MWFQTAQVGDHLLGQAVAEEFLCRDTAQILERQNKQPYFSRLSSRPGQTTRLSSHHREPRIYLIPRALLPPMAPGIQLRFERIDGAEGVVLEPVDREIFLFFPALKGAHLPSQISGNFFPGIQVIAVRVRGIRRLSRAEGRTTAHWVFDLQFETGMDFTFIRGGFQPSRHLGDKVRHSPTNQPYRALSLAGLLDAS